VSTHEFDRGNKRTDGPQTVERRKKESTIAEPDQRGVWIKIRNFIPKERDCKKKSSIAQEYKTNAKCRGARGARRAKIPSSRGKEWLKRT